MSRERRTSGVQFVAPVVRPNANRLGTRIASRIPWSSFLSAGQIVASAPRSITFSGSTK